MASIYKKTSTKPIPPDAERFEEDGEQFVKYLVNGKQVIKRVIVGRDGRERMATEAVYYTAKYRDHLGIVREYPTKCKSKDAANGVLNGRLRQVELARAGLVTTSEANTSKHQTSPTTAHMEAYLLSMESAGRTKAHIADTRTKITRLITDCKFDRLADVHRERMENWMVARTAESMAARTRNSYLQAIRGFLRWCIETSRLMVNPLDRVARADENTDRRKKRRAMTEPELENLLRVALWRPLAEYGRTTKMVPAKKQTKKRSNWTYEPLTLENLEECCDRARERLKENTAFVGELIERGQERMLTYKTLFSTGLRRNELKSITLDQVNLDAKSPSIELLAKDEKNRKGSTIPISTELARELQTWITQNEGRKRNGVLQMKTDGSRKLFQVPTGLVKILDRDLATAGIAKKDASGRTLDVHALRTTFGTMLSRAGVAPRTAQAAKRHSKIDQTMNVYTDPTLLDVSGAIASLPNVVPSVTKRSEPMQATGTTGQAAPKPHLISSGDVENVRKCQSLAVMGPSQKTMKTHEKTLGIIEKPRVFEGVTNGTRTRDLRSHNPEAITKTSKQNIDGASDSHPRRTYAAPATNQDPRILEIIQLLDNATSHAVDVVLATAKAVAGVTQTRTGDAK